MSSSRVLSVVFAASLAWSAAGHAEPADLSMERFHPSLDREGFLDVESGSVSPHLMFDATLAASYQSNPYKIFTADASGQPVREGSLVGQRADAHLVATLGLLDWVEVGVGIPATLFQAREGALVESTFGSLAAAGIGDLRAAVKVRLLRAEEAFVDVAVLATGTAPTSTRGAYFGESSFTVAPELAVSRARDFVFFGANVGGRLRGPATITPSVIGQEVYYRAGLGVRLHELQVPITIGVTANGAISVAPYEDATPYVPHEAHLGVSYDLPAWLQLFAGVGTGITVAPGAPDVRAFLGVRFSPRDAPWGSSATPKAPAPAAAPTAAADRDVDGVDDEADRCPDGAEDRDGFEDDDGCPDPDDDKDAVPDADDACPRVAGPAGGERSGCPPIDHDGDSVPDSEDLCPTVEGTVALRGCLDGAGDSIADTFDACPTVAGPPGSDGCPPPACTPGAAGCGAPLAVLTSERVELKGRVYFEAGRSTIEARSFPLLDDAARVLVAHPEIAHVRVEGHTDETGSEGDNAALSQSRANAVRDYLVQRGVDAARLRAEGFGASRPLVEGKTTKARAENRRVELVIE